MATTTNYGWTTPDDTALVKDGASAIRTLGSSIDTTTKNLNPETTLGDISYRSSTANTKTRLAIGTTGQVLTVAGGVPSWAAASTGALIRVGGGTFSAASTITADSVFTSTYQNYLITFNCTSSATNPELRYYMRTSGTNNTNASYLNGIIKGTEANGLTAAYTSGGTYFIAGYGQGIKSNQTIYIFAPQATAETTVNYTYFGNSATTATWGSGGSLFNATTSFDGIQFFPASGTLTGRYDIYGLAN